MSDIGLLNQTFVSVFGEDFREKPWYENVTYSDLESLGYELNKNIN